MAARDIVKTTALAAYVYLWAPIRNFVRRATGRSHVLIIAYHRVDDNFHDAISVGVEQFRTYMRFLKRHYDVLDMPEFLASRGKPRRRPAVVVTLDDGYENNYHAAEILREEGVPATFFISTRIVGTANPFQHDLKRLGRGVPTLSWEQVNEMAGWGFHFAPHTATHVNVGDLPLDEAVREIRTSVEDLAQRVNDPEALTWFAFPFGDKKDISPEVRDALPSLGIRFCFSEYGGINLPNFDPFDIKRQSIDCRFTLLAFHAAVEGWRV